ncbi:hypothetical protein LCGC14_0920090 [marine sediment metagenome]|uniref:Uncharacterized protein n=1 Tax=marine sediment metagenome TaxID=412755 RepID=A0A0F9NVU7_9ZZZZ
MGVSTHGWSVQGRSRPESPDDEQVPWVCIFRDVTTSRSASSIARGRGKRWPRMEYRVVRPGVACDCKECRRPKGQQ